MRKLIAKLPPPLAIAIMTSVTLPLACNDAYAAQQQGSFEARNAITLAYGAHPLQQIDFHPASASGERPLIVFVHGGAWAAGDKTDSTSQDMIRHYTGAGYHVASVNYRLVPENSVEDAAADIAAAISALIEAADTNRIDTRRVVLMGHSAGAHLAALVATDPEWLKRKKLSPQRIAGVVLLDGAAYDVLAQIDDAGPFLGLAYQLAFGGRLDRQVALSPASHTDSPNAGRFLLLHVERRDSARQASLLGNALEKSGTRVEIAEVPGRGLQGHNAINAWLGRKDFPATGLVDRFLFETFD